MSTNGKGRVVNPLAQHTFKDSGITVGLRKLSPLSLNEALLAVWREWQADSDPSHKEPQPPLAKGVGGELEPNPADPDYIATKKEWHKQLTIAGQTRWLIYAALDAVECDVDTAAVERKRRARRLSGLPPYDELPDATEEEQNKILYVTQVCIATGDDLNEFIRAVTQRSIPTAEGVQAHIATFQGDVERA